MRATIRNILVCNGLKKKTLRVIMSHRIRDMYFIFIVGTAGCGKSLLTATFSDWLRLKKQNVTSVNLDAAALSLPYNPDVDVRD